MSQLPRIVILGGGFAGLNVAKRLDKSRYEVHLVDRNNYHSFPPLFYQVASAGLDPTGISFPLRREMRKLRPRNIRFHLGEVKEVDAVARTVTTSYETLAYDYLIIALGTTNNFFSNPGLINDVFTLKSVDEAIRLRNEILYRCEKAAITTDEAERKRLLSFVVIGGGPAGVEIAGALGELKRYILCRDYPSIPPDDMSIDLLEGSDRLLRTMSEKASRTALKDLTNLMVNVRLGHVMTAYEGDRLTLDDGTELKAGMAIWTAGVTAVPFEVKGVDEKSFRGPGGRIITDNACRVIGHPEIMAIGDIGYFQSEKYPRGLPQLAQVAIQEGRYVADGLNGGGVFRLPFTYRDRGSMATIGRNRAVADIGKWHLSGFVAWAAWMFIHLISLLGMRSKLNVLLNWVWAYFTHNTALRLLFQGSPYPRRGRMHDKGDV